MTANRDTLEKLGRFLLRVLRIGASMLSIVRLLRNDWTGGIHGHHHRLALLHPRLPGIGLGDGWVVGEAFTRT